MANRRSTRGGFGLILLATQIMQIGPGRIPPVTLITVIINVVIYMRLIPNFPSVHGACTSNYYVLKEKQWLRLCTSSFYHLDDMHLYFNMASFIWKGITLERKMKSKKFLIVIALFSVLTQVVMLMLNKLFAEAFLNNQYLSTCAAGFSAVIFSLKVLTTFNSDDNVNVMGLPISVPSRYACWAELVLIHFLVPNSSFTGHLAGIIVGLLYTHGPLRKLVKGVKYLISGDFLSGGNPHSYTHHTAATGRRDSDENVAIQQAIQESLRNSGFQAGGRGDGSGGGGVGGGSGGGIGGDARRNPPPSYGWNVSDEPVTHHQDRLYPTLPTNDNQFDSGFVPSAPTYNRDGYHNGQSNYPPYPTTNNPPYPVPSNSQPLDPNYAYPPSSGIYHNDEQPQSNKSADEVMRGARLRKFGKHA